MARLKLTKLLTILCVLLLLAGVRLTLMPGMQHWQERNLHWQFANSSANQSSSSSVAKLGTSRVYKSLEDLDSGPWPPPNSTAIPRVIHQTYRDTQVPNAYKNFIADCVRLNPGWRYVLWRNADIELLLRDKYPVMAKRFQMFKTRLQRSDIARYLLLHQYGGVYLDMDVQCVRPLFPSLMRHSAFVDRERPEHSSLLYDMEYSAMNSVMGGIRSHPFFAEAIKLLMTGSTSAGDVLGTTGPHMLTRLYKRWSENPKAKDYPVTLLQPHVFSPVVDSRIHNFQKICRDLLRRRITDHQRSVCQSVNSKNWKRDISNEETIGKHWFLHIGHGSHVIRGRGRVFDITKAGFVVQFYANGDL